MKFGPVPLSEAVGKLLAHNLVDARGHRLLGKGRLLSAADIENIRELGMQRVVVAAPGPNDLDENEAARRVGAAVAGRGYGSSRRAWAAPISSPDITDQYPSTCRR